MTTPTDSGRRSPAWRKLRHQRLTQAATNNEPCWRCGQPINYQAPYRLPNGTINRRYPTCGHLDDVALTGIEIVPLDRLAPEHLTCSARAGRALQVVPGKATPTPARRDNEHTRTVAFLREPPSAGPAPAAFVSEHSTIARVIPVTLSRSPRMPGEHDGLPRFFPDPHPEAVASLGDEMVAFAEARRGGPLRWFQWLTAQRRYEVRADGSWCWLLVFESTPRQQGKSVTLAEDAAWHCSRATSPELLLHTAYRVKTSLTVQADLWPWAEGRGLGVRRLLGDSHITWPKSGADWATIAMESTYGARPWRLSVDESWAMDPVKFWNGPFPALGDRGNAQVLFFSTANPEDHGLVSDLRADPSVCRMEWGAVAGEAFDDPAVWRAASAYWRPGREVLMRTAASKPGFAEEWLNVWPGDVGSNAAWLPAAAWAAARVPGLMPHGWCVVAVEDRAGGGGFAAAAWLSGEGVATVAAEFDSLAEAWVWGDRWAPGLWLCGMSLRNSAAAVDRAAEKRGTAETAGALPALRELVTGGGLVWDSEPLADHMLRIKVVDHPDRSGVHVAPTPGVDSGPVRCAAWAVDAVQRQLGAALSA